MCVGRWYQLLIGEIRKYGEEDEAQALKLARGV
jgi:hypothetical protein